MRGASITILCKNVLHRKNAMPKRGSKSAKSTMKRIAGCTENQGSWPWVNQQHVYLFSEVQRNIEYTITGARQYSSDSLHGGLKVSCTPHFSW